MKKKIKLDILRGPKKKKMPHVSSRKSGRKSGRSRKSRRSQARRASKDRKPSEDDLTNAMMKLRLNSPISVRLSGGPDAQHFTGFKSKEALQHFLTKTYPRHQMHFVKTKQADFIVIPNEAEHASKTALSESQAKVYTLAKFEQLLRQS